MRLFRFVCFSGLAETVFRALFALNRGCMCNLLHAICCRGAKIIVELF